MESTLIGFEVNFTYYVRGRKAVGTSHNLIETLEELRQSENEERLAVWSIEVPALSLKWGRESKQPSIHATTAALAWLEEYRLRTLVQLCLEPDILVADLYIFLRDIWEEKFWDFNEHWNVTEALQYCIRLIATEESIIEE